MEVKERIQLEYQALAALQKTSEIYDMPEVLRLLIRDLQEIGASEAKRYEKQRQALVEVMEELFICVIYMNWKLSARFIRHIIRKMSMLPCCGMSKGVPVEAYYRLLANILLKTSLFFWYIEI